MTVTTPNKSEMMKFDPDQVEVIKNQLCKGITNEELKLFSVVCQKTGLDPFMKQIYAVKRKNYKTGIDDMSIQTSIDGYRLIASRTGRYIPGRKSTYEYKDDQVFSATAYVKVLASDGSWHEVEAEAFMSEYKPPVTKNGYENPFWKDKPHIMVSKCAEALALRKAFPNELSGTYTKEEMDRPILSNDGLVSDSQVDELNELFDKCSPNYQIKFNEYLLKKEINSLYGLPENLFKNVKEQLSKNSSEYQASLVLEVMSGTES